MENEVLEIFAEAQELGARRPLDVFGCEGFEVIETAPVTLEWSL